MIKKLDKLIFKSFIGPFIITFFIAFFVLMMQTIWKYIDDLVGKGLDLTTIAQFIWYTSATLLTLSMPIAILISSIMTFGNLGESFELVAIKSSGISLLRFMRPLVFVALLLCGITFLFANYVIPQATLKSATLYRDIQFKKPALDLKPGQFFTFIPGYVIKAGKKDPDGKTLYNVLVYEQSNYLQDNVIIAEKGVLNISDDDRFMEFTLQNGSRYEERGNAGDTTNEYIRTGFSSFKKLFDISALMMNKTPDSLYKDNYKMLPISKLNTSIDSLQRLTDTLVVRRNRELNASVPFQDTPDSVWKKIPAQKALANENALIPDSAKARVFDAAISLANNLRINVESTGTPIENYRTAIQLSKLEWHRKFSLSLACLVLFFIGAPLGSIIRKGGLGMPLVIAIIFFLIFHLLNMFGEKFVKESITTPFLGMWLSVIVLIPVGFFFTYKAMHDSQLFNKELYSRFFKRVRSLFSTFKKEKRSSPSV